MITSYKVQLRSDSPYSQSKWHNVPKLEKETPDAYEERTWRERMHYDQNGMVIIPQSHIAGCIKAAAKFLGMQIPGKGKQNYTKHFKAGIMVLEPIQLGIHYQDVPAEMCRCTSNGRSGGGSMVTKYFGFIKQWSGSVTVHVIDPIITQDVLLTHLEEAGKLVGVGRYRPANGGYLGRFVVENLVKVSA